MSEDYKQRLGEINANLNEPQFQKFEIYVLALRDKYSELSTPLSRECFFGQLECILHIDFSLSSGRKEEGAHFLILKELVKFE